MILNLTDEILDYDESDDLNLVMALLTAAKRGHFIKATTPKTRDWVNGVISEEKGFLPQKSSGIIKKAMTRILGGELSKNLDYINIGKDCNPDMVDRILSLPSHIFVENAHFDWLAIKRWMKLYSKGKELSDVASEISKAMTDLRIIPGNGGGASNIPHAIYPIKEALDGIHHIKITAIFDSDKRSKDDPGHNAALKNKLDEEGIAYHELHKREIENYFHPDTFEKLGYVKEGFNLHDYSAIELDFLDLSDTSEVVTLKKENVEDLAKAETLGGLKARAASPVNGADEILTIIRHLAKYV